MKRYASLTPETLDRACEQDTIWDTLLLIYRAIEPRFDDMERVNVTHYAIPQAQWCALLRRNETRWQYCQEHPGRFATNRAEFASCEGLEMVSKGPSGFEPDDTFTD